MLTNNRMTYGYKSSLPRSALNLDTVRRSIGQPDPRLHIQYAVAASCGACYSHVRLRTLQFFCANRFEPLSELLQLIRRHPCTIIAYGKIQVVVPFYNCNGEVAGAASFLDAVIDRVLHHRLQQQLKHVQLL